VLPCFLLGTALEVLGERIEPSAPEPLISFQPLHGITQRAGRQLDAVHSAIDLSRQQARGLQHAKVLGHGRQ
jgi:hypothetical protein